MSTIAELRAPASDVALETAFDRVPDLECRMEQVVSPALPNLWFGGAPRLEIESGLDADPSVTSWYHVAGGDGEWLYDVSFAEDVHELLDVLLEDGGTILSASAAHRTWSLDVRFVDRDRASRCYDRLEERDIAVDVVRLQDLTDATSEQLGLTPEQYETLVAAVEHGYFEIPRAVSMQELAEELGVSHQALSERLRRAYETLVTAELNLPGEPPAGASAGDGSDSSSGSDSGSRSSSRGSGRIGGD